MAKFSSKTTPTTLAQKKADLLAEVKRIELIEKQQEDARKWETEGKQYVIDNIIKTFEDVNSTLLSIKTWYSQKPSVNNKLIALFIDKKTQELNSMVTASIKRASQKHTLEQFQKALLRTISPSSAKYLGSGEDENEDDEETSTLEEKKQREEAPLTPTEKNQHEQVIYTESSQNDAQETNELPKGQTMGVVWFFLTSYDLSSNTTVKNLTMQVQNKELTYGKIRPSQPHVVSFAKNIYNNISTMEQFSTQKNIDLIYIHEKITVLVSLLMKSFYRYVEINHLLPEKQLQAIRDEQLAGPTSITSFLQLLHIPLLTADTKKSPHPSSTVQHRLAETLVSPQDLATVIEKINAGETEKELDPNSPSVLSFADRVIDITTEEYVIKRGASNQIVHLLMQRFNSDLHVLAELLTKTKLRKYDDDFMKNIIFAHKEIDRLVINKEISELCVKSYKVLLQFQKFVEYYCLIKKEPALETRYKSSCLPLSGVNIYTEDGCRIFLKRAMPGISHKKNTFHVYSFFIHFLNKAKGDPIAVKQIIPTLDEVLSYKAIDKPTIVLNKEKSQTTSKKTVRNNESSLMNDRDSETIEDYLLNECGIKQIQDLCDKIRNSKTGEVTASEYQNRDKLLNQSMVKMKELGTQKLLTSKDKVNALHSSLFRYVIGKRASNVILKLLKGQKPINIARELRNIITK